MKPVYQRDDTECVRACVASIFEVPIEEVPHFALRVLEGRKDGSIPKLSEWSRERGYEPVRWGHFEDARASHDIYPTAYCIAGDGEHAVVMRGGEVVHDPCPGVGLREPAESYTFFIACDPTRVEVLGSRTIEVLDLVSELRQENTKLDIRITACGDVADGRCIPKRGTLAWCMSVEKVARLRRERDRLLELLAEHGVEVSA